MLNFGTKTQCIITVTECKSVYSVNFCSIFMIVDSIILCNTLFLKASVKNKCVGFVFERLVSMGKIEASFFRFSSGPKRVCLFFILSPNVAPFYD